MALSSFSTEEIKENVFVLHTDLDYLIFGEIFCNIQCHLREKNIKFFFMKNIQVCPCFIVYWTQAQTCKKSKKNLHTYGLSQKKWT